MAFALSKLAALAMGRNRQRPQSPDLPVLRRADAHPDAPPRKPIFAQSDFETPSMFAPVIDRGPVTADAEHEPAPPMPAFAVQPDAEPIWMPEPIADAEPEFADYEPLEHSWSDAGDYEPAPAETDAADAPVAASRLDLPQPTATSAELEHLSVVELAERLERGMARRAAMPVAPRRVVSSVPPSPAMPVTGVIADMPVAEAVAVKPHVDMDIDEALRAALGTLHKISKDS